MTEKSKVTEEDVFQTLRKEPQLKMADLCSKLFVGDWVINKHLTSLIRKGTVERWRMANEVFYSVLTQHRIIDENVAGPRTFEWKPLGIYDMKSFMRNCEASRSLEKNGLV